MNAPARIAGNRGRKTTPVRPGGFDPSPQSKKTLHVALIGQPNCGKTSLFNRLTGSSQHVGNWPGVTVERKEGLMTERRDEGRAERPDHRRGRRGDDCCDVVPETIEAPGSTVIVDLPGTYSLTPYSIEEEVARDYVMDAHPDLVVNVVDATNLPRQLYLTLQVLLTPNPVVVALTMIDEAASKGIRIDVAALSAELGVEVVPLNAKTGDGVSILKETILSLGEGRTRAPTVAMLGDPLSGILEARADPKDGEFRYFRALKALEAEQSVPTSSDQAPASCNDPAEASAGLYAAAARVAVLAGNAEELDPDCADGRRRHRHSIANVIDAIALNRWLGVPAFLVVLAAVFGVTFRLGDWISSFFERGLGFASSAVSGIHPDILRSFLSDGLINGLGNVILLLPYVVIMFFMMTILEDSGYMARAAFIMDRFMHAIGLHGKSFIPLVMGFGCNVPAIMAARTLEKPSEKIRTILMIPFSVCSAKLPVFTLIAAALFGKWGGLVLFSLYFLGILLSILTGFIFRWTLFHGERSEGFIMELPPYRTPAWGNVVINTWLRAREYLIRAGSMIFCFSLAIWLLSYLPDGRDFGGSASLIGMIGRYFDVVVAPLGFDWKAAIALVTGFAAKEVIVSTLGVLYSGGEAGLPHALATAFTPFSAYAFMVFTLAYTPCVATIAAMKSETGRWKWPAISVAYGLVLAWVLGFAVVSVGHLFGYR